MENKRNGRSGSTERKRSSAKKKSRLNPDSYPVRMDLKTRISVLMKSID
jgi:hypothetical protein